MSELSLLENIFYQIFFYLKILAIILSVIMVVASIIFLLKTDWLKLAYIENIIEFLTGKPCDSKKFSKKWKAITDRLKANNSLEYKLAVVEADNFLEEILGKMKFRGETVRERLEKVPKILLEGIENIDKLHEIRDGIVHDPDYQISRSQAKEVLDIYERIFKQLNL